MAIDTYQAAFSTQTTIQSLSPRIDHGFDSIKLLIQNSRSQSSEQDKQDTAAIRTDVAHVGASLSGSLLQESAEIRREVSVSNDRLVSLIHDESVKTSTIMVNIRDLPTMHRDVHTLTEQTNRLEMAIGTLSSRVNQGFAESRNSSEQQVHLGRLLAKPSLLKEYCDDQDHTSSYNDTISRDSSYRSPLTPAERICPCRKRLTRSQKVLVLGPWRASTEFLDNCDHLPGCIYFDHATKHQTTRWSVGYTGLRRLVNRAVEFSFSYSFGAGGYSLSPNFTYYPCIDRARDPVFRILRLIKVIHRSSLWPGESSPHDFFELCIAEIVRLYRHGKASPKAVDNDGRGVLHHLTLDWVCY